MDWITLAGQLAQVGLPSLGTLLGTAFGGPLGAGIGGAIGRTAASAIGAALGVPATPQAISTAVAADPDGARLKLAEIEADAKVQADYLADVQNARQMQIVAVQAHSPTQWVPVAVTFTNYALLLLGIVFVVMGWLREDGILIGICIGAATASYQFWLGSSQGSREKDATVNRVAQSAVTPPPGIVAEQAIRAARR